MRLLFPLFFLFIASSVIFVSAQQISSISSSEYANQTINQAIVEIEMVNQSGYLIFTPNLTQAYADLNMSESLYHSSPASAVVFANKAASEANTQYMTISKYKQISFVTMFIIAVIFALIFGRLTRPVRGTALHSKKK